LPMAEARTIETEPADQLGSEELGLDVHGLAISAGGDWPEVVEEIGLDFAWFRKPVTGPPAVRVTVRRAPPDFDSHGDLRSSFVTPRNVVYQDGETTVVDYFGRAVSVLDRPRSHLVVQGEDAQLVHEAAYHFLLSRIGTHLDRRGLLRLHALGLSGPRGGIAVMLPSGGGKSTLALKALRDPECRLLSEDSPVIDRRGVVHPFPLRIGINASDAPLVPGARLRRLERMEFHPKLAVEVATFADRIEPDPQPLRHLVIGCRTLAHSSTLEQIPRHSAIGPLLREAVVGVGIYQGMEFVLQRGMRDVFGQAGTAVARARCAGGALTRSRVWRLWVGRDHERNWETLRELLDS
jgi:hypothetical protein